MMQERIRSVPPGVRGNVDIASPVPDGVKITFPLFPAAGPPDVATAHAAIATTVENERVLASWCAPSTGDRKAAALSQRRPTVMEPSVPSRLSASIKSDRVIRSLYERQTPDLAVAHKTSEPPGYWAPT
jgi:hypothetical protein